MWNSIMIEIRIELSKWSIINKLKVGKWLPLCCTLCVQNLMLNVKSSIYLKTILIWTWQSLKQLFLRSLAKLQGINPFCISKSGTGIIWYHYFDMLECFSQNLHDQWNKYKDNITDDIFLSFLFFFNVDKKFVLLAFEVQILITIIRQNHEYLWIIL